MSEPEPFITNLELRESTLDGEVGAGLAHSAEGLVLLHVLELAAAGEPRGAVTILHDAGDHGGRYLHLARRLARDGWAVALPDLRGHGRSEGARGHSAGIKEVIRDVGDVQSHLAYRMPDAPQVLIGQGLGALYALAYGVEEPDRVAALVLAAPLVEPRFELPEAPTGLKKFFTKVGPQSPGRIGYAPEAMTSDAGQRAAWIADEQTHDVVTLHAGEQIRAAAERYAEKIGEVVGPVLVLQGEADSIGSPEKMRELGGAEVRMCEGLRHQVFHEVGGDELVDDVAVWLAEQLPR